VNVNELLLGILKFHACLISTPLGSCAFGIAAVALLAGPVCENRPPTKPSLRIYAPDPAPAGPVAPVDPTKPFAPVGP
jgi:hypothetical protein